MKTNAIIRIIILSVVILVLIGILLAGLSLNLLSNTKNLVIRRDDDLNEVYTSPGAASSQVKQLDIEWVAGSITIQPGDTDTISFIESAVSDSDKQMVVKESGSKLTIQYCKESTSFPSFGINIDFSKNLVITVPRDWDLESLEIEAASAVVLVSDLSIDEVDFDGASGTCTFENCDVKDLDIDTASGDIRFCGSLVALDFDAASASFCGELTNTPSRILMDSMSGDLDIALPEDCGFTVSLDTMSSDFTSEFPTTMQNGSHTYGNGACRIDDNAMSGDVTIRKA